MKLINSLALVTVVIAPFALAGSAVHAASVKQVTTTSETKQAKSQACSAEADKQGLHGKARRAFRSKCKRSQR